MLDTGASLTFMEEKMLSWLGLRTMLKFLLVV